MYDKFYALTARPFQLNPDPAFFYGSRGHRRAMAYLEYGVHQGEGFIVITGEIGAGKTTLVRNLLEGLDPTKVVAAQLVSTQIDSSDVLRLVAAAFGVPSRGLDKAGLLLALETFLVATTAAGKRALLVVDEAQNLTPEAVEELRMLSNFQLEDHALLQSFLIGQPEFRAIMQSSTMQQLRQRVIASYHLGPLDSGETREYVLHRLRHAGWTEDPVIDPEAFPLVYQYSAGIPRKINTLFDRLLLAAFLAERHRIAKEDVSVVIAEMEEEYLQSSSVDGVRAYSQFSGELDFDANGVELPGALLEEIQRFGNVVDLGQLEARIAKLEQSLSTVVRVMSHMAATKKVVRPDGEAAK